MTVISIAFLFSPFAIAWAIAFSLYRTTRRSWHGLLMFACSTSSLAALYAIGFWKEREFEADKMLTAASLSTGLLPFKSIPILLICLAVLIYAQRRARAITDMNK